MYEWYLYFQRLIELLVLLVQVLILEG